LPDHTAQHRKFKKQATRDLPNMLAQLGKEPRSPRLAIAIGGEAVGQINDLDTARALIVKMLSSTQGSDKSQIDYAAERVTSRLRARVLDTTIADLSKTSGSFWRTRVGRARTVSAYRSGWSG